MKYVIYTIVVLAGVPWVASFAKKSEKNRAILLAVMAFSQTLGAKTAFNYLSMEKYRGVDRGFQITLTDLIAWGLLIYLNGSRNRAITKFPKGSALCVVLFLIALVSAFQAPVLMYSMFTIWKFVRIFIVFVVMANMVRIGTPLRSLYYGWTMMGLVTGFECFFQKYKMGLYRVNGFFDHSNSIPIFVLQGMSYVLLTALADPKLSSRWVWLGVASTLGMTFSVLSTQSRMGVMVAAIILLITLGIVNVLSKQKRTRIVSACVLTVLLIGAAMATKTMMERVKNAPESSAQARQEFNTAAEMMAKEHPMGIGINSFSAVLSSNSHYHAHFEVMANEIEDGQGGVAHHIYKLTAAELGPTGLYVFLLVIGNLALIGIRAGWKGRGTLLGGQAWSLAIGAVAVHVIGNFEYAFRITPICTMFAMISGAAVGYEYLCTEAKKEKGKKDRVRTLIPNEPSAEESPPILQGAIVVQTQKPK